METPYQDTMKPNLASLNRRKQLAFVLLLLERMLPLLISFSERVEDFDREIYLEGMTAIRNGLTQERTRARLASWRTLKARCLRDAPDTEKYSGEYVSHALNVALAVAATLEFLIDQRTEHIAEVTELARASIDMHIESSDTSLISESGTRRLDGHPLMLKELARQQQDIEFLLKEEEDFGRGTLEQRVKSQPPLIPIARGSRSKLNP